MSAITWAAPARVVETAIPPEYSSERWGPRFLFLAVAFSAVSLALGMRTGLGLLTFTAFCAAVVGLFRPSVGLLAIGMLCATDSVARALLMGGGLLRWNSFNYLLLLMVMFSLPAVLRPEDRQTRILLALAFLMVLGLLPSSAQRAGVFAVINVASAFGILLYYLRARHDTQIFFWIAAVNGSLTALMCLSFIRELASLPYVNPNAWSYLPLTGMFSICLGYPFATTSFRRLSLVALSVVNATWVFLSASRGSMAVAIICLLFLIRRAKAPSLLIVVPLIAGAAGWLAVSYFQDMQEYAFRRIDKLFDESRSMQNRTSGRSTLAVAGIDLFQANPLGAGTGAFTQEVAGYIGYSKKAHSAWISVAVDNGVLGVATFAAYIASFAWTGWRKRRAGLFALGLFVTAAMGAAFCSTEFVSKGLWFLAAGGTLQLHPEVYSKRSGGRCG